MDLAAGVSTNSRFLFIDMLEFPVFAELRWGIAAMAAVTSYDRRRHYILAPFAELTASQK